MAVRFLDEVLTHELADMLRRAYADTRQARRSSECSESLVSWGEGYLRGAVEAAALATGVSKDDLLGWLHEEPGESPRVPHVVDGVIHLS